MKNERWQEVERLYNGAVGRPPEERAAYLNSVCDDESLRIEVESLLACHSEDAAFIESPALEVVARELARDHSSNVTAALAGRSISHYRVVEKLGQGGMGIVYKAFDTRLNRPVALKVLPPERTSDPERKRRFVKEARAASALNHPNIVTIHDIDQADGVDFIAMEYVAGKSLDELIPRSGMRIGPVLKIAIQICEGLSRAHTAGIIHRDLKPSNIMVTGEGLVKILDFGLAKLTERQSPSDQDAGQPPSLSAETEKKMIAGTAAYMSPEQAEGRPVDARSDVFAFGSVLYEMMTGRRAFQGDSFSATLAAVVKEDPKPLSQVASDIPPGLERVVQHCLRKDATRRWQHIDDVRVELEDLKEESDSQAGAAGHTAVRKRRWWLWAAAAGVALIAAGAWLWRIRTGADLPPLQVVPLTTYAGQEHYPTFSPEGDRVAFAWTGEKGDNQDIYVKLVGDFHAQRLTTDPARDMTPAWSPDGRQIAFVRRGGTGKRGIYLISPLGGQERKIFDMAWEPTWASEGLSWTPDSKWLVFARPRPEATVAEDLSGIYLVPIDGAGARRITSPKAPSRDLYPAVSKDGKWIAFARCPTLLACDVYCQPLGPDWSPQGETRRLSRQNSHIQGISWNLDGESIVYGASRMYDMKHYLWRAWLDPGRSPLRLEYAGPYAHEPAVSPVKNRLAFTNESGEHDYDVWRFQEGKGHELLIATSMVDAVGKFSPDGHKLTFGSDRAGETHDIWAANADGSEPVQVTHESGFAGSPRWSPDGQLLVFDLDDPDKGIIDIYVVKASGGPARRLTWEPTEETLPAFSPDGKWIYFNSNRSGTHQIWRMPASGGEAQQITRNGADACMLSPDGKTLYYTRWDEGMFAVPAAGGAERGIHESVSNRCFDVTSDGIYYMTQKPRSDGRYELRVLDPSTLRSRLLSVTEGPTTSMLTVSPDRKTILYSRMKNPQSDLMLIENFR